MYLREAVNRFRALIGAVTKLGLCICKFDSEKVSASPATNLTARHCFVLAFGTVKTLVPEDLRDLLGVYLESMSVIYSGAWCDRVIYRLVRES